MATKRYFTGASLSWRRTWLVRTFTTVVANLHIFLLAGFKVKTKTCFPGQVYKILRNNSAAHEAQSKDVFHLI